MTNTNEKYLNMIVDIWFNGIKSKPRGMPIREKLNYSITLDPEDNIITLPDIRTNLTYAKEELLWYLSANPRIDFSDIIQRTWSRFSDDGIHVNSNYGVYFFNNEYGISQYDWVKNELSRDRDSRRAVININQPYHKNHDTKDMPCTMNCQMLIRDNKLHWITNMRSNDAFLGFRNDIYCFTELQKKMANELHIIPGDYIHNAASMHIYEKDYDKFKKYIEPEYDYDDFEI